MNEWRKLVTRAAVEQVESEARALAREAPPVDPPALFCCSCCPLLTPENILVVKISWTIGGGGAGRPASKYANTRFDLSLEWLSCCFSLQCWPKNQKCYKQCVLRAHNAAKCNCSRGLCTESRWSSGCTALPQILELVLRGSLRGVEGRWQGEGEGEAQEGRVRRSDIDDSDTKWLPNRLNRKPIGGSGGVEP